MAAHPLHWTVTGVLLLWAILYAGLVVFTFFLSSPDHWSTLVEEGRISQSYADYIARLPGWVVGLTIAAAATRLAGGVLLALFHSWALPVYGLSFALVSVIMFRGFVLAGVAKVISSDQIVLEVAFLFLSAFAVLYSWYQWDRGMLR